MRDPPPHLWYDTTIDQGATSDAAAQRDAAAALRRAAEELEARAAAAARTALEHDAWLEACAVQEQLLDEVDAEVAARLQDANARAAAIVAEAERATAALQAASSLRQAAALRLGEVDERSTQDAALVEEIRRLVEGVELRVGHRLDRLEQAIARVETAWDAEAPAAVPAWALAPMPEPTDLDAERSRRRRGRRLARIAIVLVAVVIASTAFRATVGELYVVASSSMEPELSDGDRLVVNRAVYRLDQPDAGDVIVFDTAALRDAGWPLSTRLVKRVVAVGGQTVEGDGDDLLVDGRPLDAEWVRDEPPGTFGPVDVPEGAVFVIGDNYAESLDSRVFGAVDVADVVGRVEAVVWPPGNVGGV